MKNTQKGFTLIELLVVISIVSLMSSVVLASLNSARAKARDAKAKSEFHNMQLALNLYYDQYGLMPSPSNGGSQAAYQLNFTQAAQTLITAGYLSAVPIEPANHVYMYLNYGPNSFGNNGTPIGALLVTYLESVAPTLAAYSGSCRPWSGAINWCDTGISNTAYCICNPN